MILCVYLYTHIIGDFFLPSIEVPGIGYIDANGFAEEQTMQRILAAIQRQNGDDGGPGLGTLASGANKAGSALQGVASAGRSVSGSLDDASRGINRSSQEVRIAQQRYARSVRDLQGISRAAAQGPLDTIMAAGGALKKGITKEGGILDILGERGGALARAGIDGIALALGAVAGDINEMGKQYRQAQQSGALLGGDMVAFRTAAITSGLSMQEFNNILSKQGSDFARFAGQTRVGALEFMRQNADLINTQGQDLLRLGLSFEDMGSRTAEFLGNLTLAGESIDNFRYDTGSLSLAIRQQVVQQKALAAINGTTLEQERDKQRAARQDMVLQASLNGLNAKNKDEINALVAAYPQIGTAIKEIAVFGSVTTEAGAMQMMANQGLTDTLEPLVRSLGMAGGNIEYVGNAALQAQRLVDQNRGAIAGDVETQQQISQLAMLGANNKFISAGVDSVEKGYEYNMKVLGGVIENVLGELNGPLTNFGTAAGNTTQTLNRMDMGLRDFTNRIAGMATAMYSTDIFAAGLQSTANATLGNARTGLALGEKVISTAFGTEPRIGSSGLGLTGQQNAPVEPGAAFKGLDFYGENGLIDYFTGGMGTEFKNMVTSMNETKDEIAKNNEKVDETNNGIKTTNNLLNTVIQNQNKQTTAIQNQ
jgi:hypothetical protein